MSSSIDELVVSYDPAPAWGRVQRWRRLLRSRLISLGISVLMLIVIFVWQRVRLMANPVGTTVVYAVVLLTGIAWALVCWIALRRSRRAAARLGDGVALRVNRGGIELAGRQIGWLQLASLTTAKGTWPSGPVLRADCTDGTMVEIPLEQLRVLPATLDSTVRAYSSGRHGLDLSSLDV